ncbi:hypothetical protein NCH01_28190 [Neoasaia chiangmaiensis]|uniref:beta-ketoacyl synthase chain length factor n=1 Tax=Neoasaia chiangmaiensis TaxID=320497 RepID=UPI00098A9043|nr:beta-ketoacyl synthase chain length factor [Neoasaia chiangmaiensis]GEN16388.1 hypothetical protein NCH01_28190 [Neoasaia chiangmaiensis]
MKVILRGTSVWGPGLSGWLQAAPVLRGDVGWASSPVLPPAPSCLPPNERRRCGPVTRLALALAEDACVRSGLAPAALRSVFASSNGDGGVVDDILGAVTTPGGEVSPTRFHNSVHNATAGYWTIGQGTIAPAAALGCFDWSFGQGLLKAMAECVVEDAPVLFVAYDLPIPGPIGTVRITQEAFGCALLLDPATTTNGLATLDAAYCPTAVTEDDIPLEALDRLAMGNPAARSIPLLREIARGGTGKPLQMVCQPGILHIKVTPCP